MAILGILADDGIATRLCRRIFESILTVDDEADIEADPHADEGDPRIVSGVDSKGRRVELRTGSVPMDEDGRLRLSETGEAILDRYDWEGFIYVTDLPLTKDKQPVASQRADDARAVLVSLPAFGAVRMRVRLQKELKRLFDSGVLRADGPDGVGIGSTGRGKRPKRTLTVTGFGSVCSLLLGMVRCNQPGALLPALSGCLAAIGATGGFGIFYGSVWEMANSVSAPRQLLISVFAIAVLTFWLIFHNGLWHRGRSWRAGLDNAATVLTVLVNTILIYLAAVALMLVLTVVVVPNTYMGEQLSREIGWAAYGAIGWFTASLGTMGGALGSNFDKEVQIQSATYSARDYKRRQRSGYYDS